MASSTNPKAGLGVTILEKIAGISKAKESSSLNQLRRGMLHTSSIEATPSTRLVRCSVEPPRWDAKRLHQRGGKIVDVKAWNTEREQVISHALAQISGIFILLEPKNKQKRNTMTTLERRITDLERRVQQLSKDIDVQLARDKELLARIRSGQGYWRAMHCVDSCHHPYDETAFDKFPLYGGNASSTSTDKAVVLVERSVSKQNEHHKSRDVNSNYV
mmetsp:Transcript_12732/g.24455  ORF Transcript_12732/g.24455 Transcript_12732/m.24455 type:complete len:217 (+) Transcript_12732:79-729(+)